MSMNSWTIVHPRNELNAYVLLTLSPSQRIPQRPQVLLLQRRHPLGPPPFPQLATARKTASLTLSFPILP